MSCSNCCDSNDITLPEATDGVGISSITLNANNTITITYTNGTTTTTSAITVSSASTNVLHNDTTSETTAVTTTSLSAAPTPVAIGTKSYTLPANTVTTDGSEIKATAWFKATTTASETTGVNCYIYCNGGWIVTPTVVLPSGAYILQSDSATFRFRVDFTLIRKSNTTVFAHYTGEAFLDSTQTTLIKYSDYKNTPASLGVFDFTATAIDFECYAAVRDVATGNSVNVICESFTVEHYKK